MTFRWVQNIAHNYTSCEAAYYKNSLFFVHLWCRRYAAWARQTLRLRSWMPAHTWTLRGNPMRWKGGSLSLPDETGVMRCGWKYVSHCARTGADLCNNNRMLLKMSTERDGAWCGEGPARRWPRGKGAGLLPGAEWCLIFCSCYFYCLAGRFGYMKEIINLSSWSLKQRKRNRSSRSVKHFKRTRKKGYLQWILRATRLHQ